MPTHVTEAARREATSALRARPFRLLLLGTFCGVTGYMLLLPVVPLWAIRGGGESAAAGATTAVFMGVTVGVQMLVPRLLRHVPHRVLLSIGYLLMGVPTLGYLLSAALPSLLAVSAVRGVGFGLMTVVANALIAELLPVSAHGRGSSRYGVLIGLSTVLFLPTGVWVAEHLGFWVVFVAATVLPTVAVITGWAIGRLPAAAAAGGHDPDVSAACPAREIDSPRAADHAELAEPWPAADAARRDPDPAARARRPVGSLLLPALPMLAGAVSSTIVVTFAADVFAPGLTTIALLVFGLAVTGGRLAAGVLRDRSGHARLLVPGHFCLVAGAASIALAAAGLGTGPGLLIGSVLIGFGFGALQNDALVAMFERVSPSRYAVASTVWNVAYDGGTGLGSIGVGVLALAGYPQAFVLVGIVVLLLSPAAVGTVRAGRLPRAS